MNRLTCKDAILNYLADYLDESLDAEALADFERHLLLCAACRAYLDTYKKTGDIVRQAAVAPMPQEMKAQLQRFLLTCLTSRRP